MTTIAISTRTTTVAVVLAWLVTLLVLALKLSAANSSDQALSDGHPAGQPINSLGQEADAVLGNPVSRIPLANLSATRDRPLFSPTRRPPPPGVNHPPPITLPAPAQPERPQFSLVGTVIGEQGAIGVFVESASKQAFRLRIGDIRGGWILRDIQQRSASLEKSGGIVAIELPALSQGFRPQSTYPPGR